MVRKKAYLMMGILGLGIVLSSCCMVQGQAYEPTWESLKEHNPAPDWFRDAKFGIYFHWGVYSVPAFGSEWYPRNMHIKRQREYRHHLETYGDPTKYSYAKFVPQFRAEKFDAEAWADLFVKTGARFAGPVAEHHDGYALWASKLTPWNARDMGPKRDITGELASAIRKRGMKFVATFHHARNNLWQKNGNWTGHYEFVKKDFPSLLENPQEAILYGYMPREQFLTMWFGKLKEVIDNYQPDLIWFDSWLDEIPEEYQKSFLAYYLNRAKQWQKDVVVTYKQRDLPMDVGVLDLEKGRMNQLTEFSWLTDDTISLGSWCYTQDLRIKSTSEVLHVLIDIVSKNGQLLLNISPMADGTIPENQRKVLLGIGEWLKINGEAIYETRPWLTFGEGPTRLKKGGGFVRNLEYTSQDIRYTRKGDVLYAICLGRPEGEVRFQSLQVKNVDAGAKVTLLGSPRKIDYSIEEEQLVLNVSAAALNQCPSKHAYAFKLEGFDLELDPTAYTGPSRQAVLKAEQAVLEGEKIDLEEKFSGRKNIGFWDKPEDKIHWLVKISQAGTYAVSGDFATTGSSRVALDVPGETLTAELPGTGGWDKVKKIQLGQIKFDKAGVFHVTLRPANPANWKAVNVWQLMFVPK
jgi:alpha-L-fucosidase